MGLTASAIAGGEGGVAGRGAVDILLVKEAVHREHGHFAWDLGELPVESLVLPVVVVGRVVEQAIPGRQLVGAIAAAQLAG